jgi:hypothetical protein
MGKINPQDLHQHWVHSQEEDTATEAVYRPDTYPFPPARGRTSFDLRPLGALVKSAIAPDDRRAKSQGNWKLEDGDKLAFYADDPAKPEEVMRIASVTKDKLVIHK